eukprot:m.255941 g.255941  ORF g.255941 m.255941 type:complete len:174 (+) comp11013_c0_seq1:722-1243(+)
MSETVNPPRTIQASDVNVDSTLNKTSAPSTPSEPAPAASVDAAEAVIAKVVAQPTPPTALQSPSAELKTDNAAPSVKCSAATQMSAEATQVTTSTASAQVVAPAPKAPSDIQPASPQGDESPNIPDEKFPFDDTDIKCDVGTIVAPHGVDPLACSDASHRLYIAFRDLKAKSM